VTDGQISANSSSVVRDSAGINELQRFFNTYKPDFQNGTMDSGKLLNLRDDLAGTADYQKALRKNVQEVARGIRSNLNKDYRSQVPGLTEKDADYTAQKKDTTSVLKDVLGKDGNLLDSAVNRIANAGGKGKDLQLEKLERLVPGITKKLEVLKAMEDIQKAGGTKVGTYPSSILKAGGVIAGLATGSPRLIGASLATLVLSSPGVAVPLLRLFGDEKGIVSATMAHLAKFVTIGAVASKVTSGSTAAQI
jgi:hypothetical protein